MGSTTEPPQDSVVATGLRAVVVDHFAPQGFHDRLAAVLRAAGRDATNTTVADLASFDQMNTLGAVATRRLGEQAGIGPGTAVLDVGCGLGGPARYLAETFGCSVTGIDLAPEFLRAAEHLTALTGLADRVRFRSGDVTRLPFDDATFDVVWTQHVAQSVPEKEAFYGEMARVLKPGGRLVLHDLFEGDGSPFTFPSGAGTDPSTCFVEPLAAVRERLERNGLDVHVDDLSTETLEWMREAISSAPAEPAIPGLDFRLYHDDPGLTRRNMENAITDIASGAMGFFSAVATKPVASSTKRGS